MGGSTEQKRECVFVLTILMFLCAGALSATEKVFQSFLEEFLHAGTHFIIATFVMVVVICIGFMIHFFISIIREGRSENAHRQG